MWLMKLIVFVCLFNLVDSYAGPRNYGFKVYKHFIEVTEISLENPMPKPGPKDEGAEIARIKVKYH